ncbi:glycosyltransferase family 39 protein [Moorena sp. SIO4G3]|uniref:glycosyltransferase family 39 protein n=1 Tax=Moorena sp. SIO4G3 TaxID=2607821 RepID=UPI00260114B8|nr:glycosyltransferase family 39 protein [Moorena sp. SIO4G3]
MAIFLIVLGIFFRFYHLENKIYWHDETFTSMGISGHTLAELKQEIVNEQVTSFSTLDQYQYINPDRGIDNTVRYLIESDPHHPPFYYVLVRLWAQIFGDSPSEVRILSAIFSLLIIPAFYWLCLELFGSSLVGYVGISLVAVSPLHILFAEEARQYSLWTLICILSSAALLWAIRRETFWSWSVYSLILCLGFYTHLLTALVAIAHGTYVAIKQSFRLTKTALSYLCGTLVASILFLPWLLVLIGNVDTAVTQTSWLSSKFDNPFSLILSFFNRTRAVFFDVNLANDTPWIDFGTVDSPTLYIAATAFSLFLLTYVVYFLFQEISSRKGLLFISLLGFFCTILFLLYDLIFGGVISSVFRYHLPFYVGLQLVFASVITLHIFSDQLWQQRMGILIASSLLIASIISDVSIMRNDSWWLNEPSHTSHEISKAINQFDSPLLIIDDNIINLGAALVLSHQLDSKTHLLSMHEGHSLELPLEYTNIFLLDLSYSQNLFEQARQEGYSLRPIYPLKRLWKISA